MPDVCRQMRFPFIDNSCSLARMLPDIRLSTRKWKLISNSNRAGYIRQLLLFSAPSRLLLSRRYFRAVPARNLLQILRSAVHVGQHFGRLLDCGLHTSGIACVLGVSGASEFWTKAMIALMEAFYISTRGDACFGRTSICLLDCEMRFLRGLWWPAERDNALIC